MAAGKSFELNRVQGNNTLITASAFCLAFVIVIKLIAAIRNFANCCIFHEPNAAYNFHVLASANKW